jgi:hypothetical protein
MGNVECGVRGLSRPRHSPDGVAGWQAETIRCKDVDELAGWGCRRGEDCRAWEQGRCLGFSWRGPGLYGTR